MTPDAADQIALELLDLAADVRRDPGDSRAHVSAAESILDDLRALYAEVGEP